MQSDYTFDKRQNNLEDAITTVDIYSPDITAHMLIAEPQDTTFYRYLPMNNPGRICIGLFHNTEKKEMAKRHSMLHHQNNMHPFLGIYMKMHNTSQHSPICIIALLASLNASTLKTKVSVKAFRIRRRRLSRRYAFCNPHIKTSKNSNSIEIIKPLIRVKQYLTRYIIEHRHRYDEDE